MKNFQQKPVIFAGRGIPGEDVAGCGSISEGEAAGHPGISRSPELRINISFPSRCSSCTLRGFFWVRCSVSFSRGGIQAELALHSSFFLTSLSRARAASPLLLEAGRGRSVRSGAAAGRARGQSRRAGCGWMRVPAAGGLMAQPRRGSAGGGEGAAP